MDPSVSAMKVIKPKQCRRMLWANGGGETVEIAVSPPGATFSRLDWRISAASVVSDGPFSYLGGIDRTLLVTEGAGLLLNCSSSDPVRLTPDDDPWVFAGELAVEAKLIGGPVVDLNVMTRRDSFNHSVTVRRDIDEIEVINPGGVLVFSMPDSSARYEMAGSHGLLDRGDFVILESEARLRLRPDATSRFYEIRLSPV